MAGAVVEVGGDPPGLRLSVSQIQKFTSCENKWYLQKVTPADDRNFASSDAMDLGTLMHTLLGAWYSAQPWELAWIAAAIEAVGETEIAWRVNARGRLVDTKKGWEVPVIFLRAKKIMERWVEVHGFTPKDDPDTEVPIAGSTIVATELPFDLPVPGVKDARIRGFIDGLISTPVDGIRVHDRTRLLEFKTMGRWGRENQVPFDLQLNVYLWAARQMFQVDGAIFEAVSTYDYKTGGPEQSFKRIPLDFDQRLVDRTMQDVAAAARRMKAVLKNPGLIVRSVGEACTYCDFRKACLTPWEE
jgi:CRISPR/Cas system-associated exonuclease Cas4 (RecB family)